MQKITTLFAMLIMASSLFSSCKDKKSDSPEPDSCLLIKDWLVSSGNRSLLSQYELDASNKISKITRYELDGTEIAGRVEYNQSGKIDKIYDKLSTGVPVVQYNGVLKFGYTDDGNIYNIDAFNIENNSEALVQTLIFYNDASNRVQKVVSSFGVYWRYEYDENGNVIKTYFQPDGKGEYLWAEVTDYNDKLQANTIDKALLAKEIYTSHLGLGFSRNQALSYKIYNEDGSLNATTNITREYDTDGNQIKATTNSTSNGTTISTVVETEYPSCK